MIFLPWADAEADAEGLDLSVHQVGRSLPPHTPSKTQLQTAMQGTCPTIYQSCAVSSLPSEAASPGWLCCKQSVDKPQIDFNNFSSGSEEITIMHNLRFLQWRCSKFIFTNVMPCWQVNSYQRFEQLYCLHSFWTALPCSWGHYDLLKCHQLFTTQHAVTSQKTWIHLYLLYKAL